MNDIRINMLVETRHQLEEMGGPLEEREYLLRLVDILISSIERYSQDKPENIQEIARSLIDNRALLAMLKQQGDELDALKTEFSGMQGKYVADRQADLTRYGAKLARREATLGAIGSILTGVASGANSLISGFGSQSGPKIAKK